MCGRYTIYTKKEVLEERFGASFANDFEAHYNAAPSQHLPIIRNDQPNRLELAAWSFLPSWARNPASMKPQINARAETLRDKPYWRGAFSKHRCLVPADGYYEWKPAGDRKQPWFIRLTQEEPFAMAGLYATFMAADGTQTTGFAIITTQATGELAEIHHRMPVILQPADESAWLSAELAPADAADLLKARTDMTAVPVSTRVNSPQNNSPELIAPVRLMS